MEKTINIILQIFSVCNIPIVCKKRWKQKIKQKNGKITRQQKVMIKYKIFVKCYKNTYNIDKMKRIQQNIQKPKQISIPSSNSSQQILTPHWGGHQKYQVPKMSRLDELLSRNQQIYQNMRNQLMEISRSNRNIDVNINNIKPLYQSQCTEQENIQEQSDSNYYMQYPQQTEQNNQIPPNFIYSQSTYKQPYTFQQKSSIDQNSQSPPKIIISRPKQTSNSSNSRLAQNYTKSKQHTVTKSHITNSSQSLSSYPSSSHKNKFIYSLGESLGSTYNGRGGQGPHAQEHIQKSIFQESDSSPIQSEKFASKQIYYMAKNQNHIDAPPYKFRKKSSHNTINQVSLNLSQASKKSMNKREQKQLEKRKSSSFLKKSEQVISYQVASERKNYQDQQNKYQTYEQDPNISLRVEQKSNHTKNKGSNILVYKQNYAEQYFPSIMHNKQKNKCPSNVNLKIKINSLLNGNENKLRSNASLPQKLSVIFIPFNRLYSSPILQQSNKKQLTLARKSRTHTTSNNLVNRIICGKKYKNIHMINQQVNLYQNILQYIGQVQEVLKMKRKLLSQNKGNIQFDYIEKQSVDIGIVGGQNSLKKKIHYALIAHIYTDLLKLIKNYYQQQTKKENIQNNQETLQEIQSQVQAQSKISKIMIGIEHQEQQAMSDPYVIRYQGQISQESIQNQIVYGNIRAVIQAIFQCMKMKLPNTQPSQTNTISNRIRVTKLFLKIPIHTRSQNYASSDSNNAETQKANKQYLSVHNTKIVSTNNLNRQLITKLQLDAIIWCVNPLFKYFDQTQTLLDCYTAFKTHLKANNKEK